MIELVFFFHHISDIVLDLVNSELYLRKACISENTTGVPGRAFIFCYGKQEGFVSFVWPVTGSIYRWAMLFLCVFYVSLATSWSDTSGRRRRPLVFIAIFGQIMQSICGLMNYFLNSGFIVTFICNSIFEFIGGINMMFVVAQIYICETVAVENRTMRLGLLWVVKLVCKLICIYGYGNIIHNVGSLYSYILCLVLSIIAGVLAAFRVYDKFVVSEEKQSFSQLFDVTRIVHSFKLVFKQSLGKKRQLVLLLLIAYVLMYCVYEGENGTTSLINSLLESLTGTTLHRSSFEFVKDFAIIFNMMLKAFHGVILLTSVSYLSKFFDGKEFGRLFSVLNIFFCFVLINTWVYGILFAKTINSYSLAAYLGSIFLNIAVLVLYCISFFYWRLVSDPEL
ncbi:uncharacterized protein LOC135838959 isoform X2 [Planococcus citri]|uniref:uncharacterized protein LOC135838959 isoform X2 n=1 Tax=Planococcus citri TaxID=170843 RepID=UPI0031F98549